MHMDNMEEARRKRAAALEEKRRRLEELRRKRAEREGGGGGDIDASSSSAAALLSPVRPPQRYREAAAAGEEDKEALDELINTLLAAPVPSSSSGQPPQQQSQQEEHGTAEPAASPRGREKGGAIVVVKGLGKLHIPPSPVEAYSKGTQTDPPEEEEEADSDAEDGIGVGRSPYHRRAASGSSSGVLHSPAAVSASARRGSLARRGEAAEEEGEEEDQDGGDGEGGQEEEAMPPVLTDAERAALLGQPVVQALVARASLVVERALGQEATHDILVDYAAGTGSVGFSLGGEGGGEGGSGRKRRKEEFTRLIKFTDLDNERGADGSGSGRAVMALDWSPHYNELLLAAYGRNMGDAGADSSGGSGGYHMGMAADGGEQADGLVLVWSLGLPSRPEYRFRSPSPVLAAKFHDRDPHLVLGGTYSGQVVLWDIRAKSLPVQRTPLSANGHAHPVYSLGLAGEAAGGGGSPTLVTASSDGSVCYWSLSQLHEPLETVQLLSAGGNGDGGGNDDLLLGVSSSSRGGSSSSSTSGNKGGGRPVTVAALAMDRAKNGDELIVGSECGRLYLAPALHKQAGKPRGGLLGGKDSHGFGGAATVQPLGAHYGLITSLALHPSTHSRTLSSLLLSASVDWSMRLWTLPPSSSSSSATTPRPSSSTTPLPANDTDDSLLATLTHEGNAACDYVVDAQWCPSHPAAFASATASGGLYLWNLGQSMEAPVTKPFAVTPPGQTTALTKLAWSSEGRKLAVGDAKGNVHVVGVDAALVTPRVDEEVRLEEALLALRGGGLGGRGAGGGGSE